MANDKTNQVGITEILQKILMDDKVKQSTRDLALYILADSEERILSFLSLTTAICALNLSTLNAINQAALMTRGIVILTLDDIGDL